MADFFITREVQELKAWDAAAAAEGLTGARVRERAQMYAAAALVPLSGEALQKHGSRGIEPDGHTLQRAAFRFEARRDLRTARFVGLIPEHFGGYVEVTLRSNGAEASMLCAAGREFTCVLHFSAQTGNEYDFEIELSRSYQPSSRANGSSDERRLGCAIVSVDFR